MCFFLFLLFQRITMLSTQAEKLSSFYQTTYSDFVAEFDRCPFNMYRPDLMNTSRNVKQPFLKLSFLYSDFVAEFDGRPLILSRLDVYNLVWSHSGSMQPVLHIQLLYTPWEVHKKKRKKKCVCLYSLNEISLHLIICLLLKKKILQYFSLRGRLFCMAPV